MSTRTYNQSKPLNEYLEPDPNLQNQIWKILVQTSFNSVAICVDLKQAFLQIRIQETCIKISLDQRSRSTKTRNIPIHEIGIWTNLKN